MSRLITLATAVALLAMGSAWVYGATTDSWSSEERDILKSLALSQLEPLPADPSNRVGDRSNAAQLGRRLFFDSALSSNGKVSCATCHLPEKDFQDGTPLAHGVGVTGRRTMPIAGTAHSPWMFWDGRRDSQWAQALGPLESPVEHNGDRTQYAKYVSTAYRNEYEGVFGPLPDLASLPQHAGPNGDSLLKAEWSRMPAVRRDAINQVYANIGKAIAAFERRIMYSASRFDRYVDAEIAGRQHTSADSLSPTERAGLKLFIGKANCVNCHNGPRLTDDHFHNTGVAASTLVAAVDSGRTTGVRDVRDNEFNCLGRYSDAKPEQCAELRFAVTEGRELLRAFKTPSLRNVAARAPYMHAGQVATLTDVVDHYARSPKAPFGTSELKPIRLSREEREALVAFLGTLSSPAVMPPAP
jgi:cytochrome c peroxidase